MAGIEEAFEKFSDRLAREESKRYSRDEQGDYVEEVQDPYPLKLGPLELGANANITTGQYSPDEYQNVSTMNRNVGVRGKLNIPDSGIALLGSIGDVRSSSKNKLNLPFNPMTGEAESYSETMRDVYKDSPYSVGAQYNPKGTDQLFSALYNKGGGYNLGYNQGPVNVSYTSNPGLGNNVMLRGQYNFADGGVASMFRERPGYQEGGSLPNSATAPSGIEYELFYSPFSGKPLYRPKYDPSRTDLVYSGTDPEEFFKTVMSTGTSIPTTTEIPTVDPFSGQSVSGLAIQLDRPLQLGDPIGSFYNDPNNQPITVANTSTGVINSTTTEVPTIQSPMVSPDDSMNAYQPESTGPTINPALSLLGNYFGIGSLPEIQNFDMFSKAQQQSIQDAILRSVQPQDNLIQLGNVSPTNIPVSSYLSYFPEDKITQAMTQQNISSTGFGNIRSQTADQLRALTGDPSATARMSLGRFNVNVDPLKGTANIADTYDFSKYLPGKPMNINIPLPQEFTQQLINNPYYQQTLAKQDPTTYSQLQQQRSQQEASARVTPTRMAYGGRVSMSDGGLTTTIAPVKGPDSQGVESLFRRRYN